MPASVLPASRFPCCLDVFGAITVPIEQLPECSLQGFISQKRLAETASGEAALGSNVDQPGRPTVGGRQNHGYRPLKGIKILVALGLTIRSVSGKRRFRILPDFGRKGRQIQDQGAPCFALVVVNDQGERFDIVRTDHIRGLPVRPVSIGHGGEISAQIVVYACRNTFARVFLDQGCGGKEVGGRDHAAPSY